MLRTHATQVEGMPQEKIELLATAHSEAVRATQRVSILGDELVATHRPQDATEERVLTQVAKAATADQ
jgi:hypothetical protein